MLRTVICAVALLGMGSGLAQAQEVVGKITSVNGKKLTFASGGQTTTYDIADNCRVSRQVSPKSPKTDEVGGLNSQFLKNIDASRGVVAALVLTNGRVTEIVLRGRPVKGTG